MNCPFQGVTATTLSTEPHSSRTGVLTFQSAFNLTPRICLFLCKDGEPRPECRKAQCRHSHRAVREKMDHVSVDRGFLPIRQQTKLRERQVCEGIQHTSHFIINGSFIMRSEIHWNMSCRRQHDICVDLFAVVNVTQLRAEHRGRRSDPLEA